LQARAARTAALWLHAQSSFAPSGAQTALSVAAAATSVDQALAPVLQQLQCAAHSPLRSSVSPSHARCVCHRLATQYAPQWPKAWQSWAMMHYEALRRHRDVLGNAAPHTLPKRLVRVRLYLISPHLTSALL